MVFNSEFEKELLDAIEVAIAGVMIRPSWILGHIKPVIERHCQSADEVVCTCSYSYGSVLDPGNCGNCGKPFRR